MAYKFIQSPYWQSRNGKKIDGVVIHTTVGTYEGTIGYFQNNDRSVSAHYCVSLDGDITQMVDEKVGANHAGIISNPKSPVYEGFNPNWNTVGIENADNLHPADADRTHQYPALAALVKDICQRNNIPIDRNHICGHRELYDKKTCPGNIDVDLVVKMASGNMGDVAAWLNQMFVELGIDLTKTEGEVRGRVQEVIDGYKNFQDLEKQIDRLKKDLAFQSGQAAEFEKRLEISEGTIKDLRDSLQEARDGNVTRDTQISKLQSQIAALEKAVDPETKVVISKEEYARLTANRTLDKFKSTELITEVIKRIFGKRGE